MSLGQDVVEIQASTHWHEKLAVLLGERRVASTVGKKGLHGGRCVCDWCGGKYSAIVSYNDDRQTRSRQAGDLQGRQRSTTAVCVERINSKVEHHSVAQGISLKKEVTLDTAPHLHALAHVNHKITADLRCSVLRQRSSDIRQSVETHWQRCVNHTGQVRRAANIVSQRP